MSLAFVLPLMNDGLIIFIGEVTPALGRYEALSEICGAFISEGLLDPSC